MTSVIPSAEVFAAYKEKRSAKFKELYTAAGEPTELDDSFIKEYLTSVVSLENEHGINTEYGTSSSIAFPIASFAKQNSDLVKMSFPNIGKRFEVAEISIDVFRFKLASLSYNAKNLEGTWDYEIQQTLVPGIVFIDCMNPVSGRHVHTFNISRHDLKHEKGKGTWKDL